jgi:hypothetical protein
MTGFDPALVWTLLVGRPLGVSVVVGRGEELSTIIETVGGLGAELIPALVAFRKRQKILC